MRAAAAASSTIPRPGVTKAATFMRAVVRHAGRMKDTLRWARSRTKSPQSIDYVKVTAKAVLSGKQCKAVEIVTALVIDIAQRGELGDAESIGQHLTAIARAEYAAAHPTERAPLLSFAEASIAEERAQGEMENAEEALKHFPTLTNRLRLIAASKNYERAKRIRDARVELDAGGVRMRILLLVALAIAACREQPASPAPLTCDTAFIPFAGDTVPVIRVIACGGVKLDTSLTRWKPAAAVTP